MQSTRSRQPLLSFGAVLVLSAFALNWFWEMFQMPAFVETAGRSWADTSFLCARAAVGDVVMTLGIYGLGALAARNWYWGLEERWNMYLTGALLGGVFAMAYEWNSLAFDRWSYSERMPIVPVLRIGLWPLLQLPVLVPASWATARWCTVRIASETPCS